MIKIIESVHTKNEHEIINGKIIEEISNKLNSVEIFCSESQIKVFKKYLKNNYNYNSLKEKDKKDKKNKVFNLLSGMFEDIKILLSSSSKDTLIFLAINPLGIINLKLINYFLKRDIYMFHHGELDYIEKKQRTIFNKILSIIFSKTYFLIKKDKIKYIILGESLIKNLKKDYQDKIIENKYIVIDHPYIYPEQILDLKKQKKKKIKLGTVGIANLEKGVQQIFELSKRLENEITENKIELEIIGRIDENLYPFLNDNVNFNLTKELLKREEFEEKINELDYILFFYNENSYKLRASGAFFDALVLNKPILALDNSFFNYYIDKYEVGFKFNELKKMEEKIREILEKKLSEEEYSKKVENIQIAKKMLNKKFETFIEKIIKKERKNSC